MNLSRRRLPFVAVAICFVGAQACSATTAPSLLDAAAADVGEVEDAALVADAAGDDASPEREDTSNHVPHDAEATDAKDAGADAYVDAGTPSVQLLGRWDGRGGALVCSWPACMIRARFMGSEVSVRMEENFANWMNGAPSEWEVRIDGVLQPKLVLAAGTNDYALASALTAGVHELQLSKRSEALNGSSHFISLSFGAAGVLLAPPVRPTRRLQVIGASNVTGYGIDGISGQCGGLDGAARYQDANKTYAAELARRFDAELELLAYSGKGLVQNYWRPDTEVMGQLLRRTAPMDPSSVQAAPSLVPDLVMVDIGGNDFAIGAPNDTPVTTLEQFTAAYEQMVAAIRHDAPTALIVLMVPPDANDTYPAGRQVRSTIQTALSRVVAARASVQDTRVMVRSAGASSVAEQSACANHPTAALHQRIANEFEPWLRAQLGW